MLLRVIDRSTHLADAQPVIGSQVCLALTGFAHPGNSRYGDAAARDRRLAAEALRVDDDVGELVVFVRSQAVLGDGHELGVLQVRAIHVGHGEQPAEIDDEMDEIVAGVRKQVNGSYMIDSTVTIRDLNRWMNWDLPDEEAVTIAGLLIHDRQLVLATAPALTWSKGQLRDHKLSGGVAVSKRVDATRLPAPLRALADARVIVYAADGSTCTATNRTVDSIICIL